MVAPDVGSGDEDVSDGPVVGSRGVVVSAGVDVGVVGSDDALGAVEATTRSSSGRSRPDAEAYTT